MDQPFESDVMDDLASDTPNSSSDEFDEYEGMDEEAFEEDAAFADGMDEFDGKNITPFEDAYEDNLEGDLWDDYGESGDEFKPHHTNRRSHGSRHEQGQRRPDPHHRPLQHRRAWPPRDSFSDDSFAEEVNEFEQDFGDEVASGDEFAEGESVDAVDAMEEAIADALEAEDSDEFLRRFRQALNVARQVGRGIGSVARVVAPISNTIPHPAAQAISRVASVAGRLLADGADEFEALDEMLAFAEEEDAVDAAAPIIAGLTIRTIMPRAARLNRTTRRQLVRSVSQSTRTLARRQGTPAIRAIPRVVQAVQRTVQRRRVPAQQLPQAVRRATATVARNPRLVSRLAQATQQASSVTRRYATRGSAGIPQRLVIRGPVEIMIRSR